MTSPAAGRAGWKPCIIYARVSTEEQGKGNSIATQIAAARKRAEERGYAVVGVFQDEHTGTEIDRPGLSALYDALARTQAPIVICLDTDRLGRGWPRAFIEREIEGLGATVEYLLADYSGDAGELQKDIRGAIDAFENRQRVERSRRGKNGRALAGSVVITASRTPYGYTYVPRTRGGDLVIDEEEAAVVRRIFALLVESRLSSYAIARILTAEGVPTKADRCPPIRTDRPRTGWAPTSIRTIVRNRTYTGVWHWGKTRTQKQAGRRVQVAQPADDWIAVPVPAIVDTALWERAQPCLQANKQQARRNAKRDYLLASRIFCVCGRRWVGRYKAHLDRGYYGCPANVTERWRTACPSRFSYRQDRIEPAVWRYVFGELLSPTRLAAEIARQREAAQAETATRAARLGRLQAQLGAINRKLDILISDVLNGMPADRIDVHKRGLLADRADVEDQIARAWAEAERQSITADTVATVQEIAAIVQAAEPQLTAAERRRLLEILRVRVDVLDAGHARVSGLVTGSIVDVAWASRVHNTPTLAPTRTGSAGRALPAVGAFRLPFAADLPLVAHG